MPKALSVRRGAAFALFATLSALCVTPPAAAQVTDILGTGRLFNNDAFGDGKDRWRSGSYALSRVIGPVGFDGTLPQQLGNLREWRLRTEIIQPASLTAPAATDRRFAGILSFGMHSHFALGRAEASLGGDLVVTGAQTGIGRFQRAAHKAFGITQPTVLGNQIGNAIHPTILAEVGMPMQVGTSARLRPFAEAQAGIETFVRIGADLVIGEFGSGALMLRDVATGQRYRGTRVEGARGFSFTLGGDVAHVGHSALLPSGGPATLNNTRTRLRAGLHWQGERSEVFYGLTRMGREFDEQPKGQTVGSMRLSIRF